MDSNDYSSFMSEPFPNYPIPQAPQSYDSFSNPIHTEGGFLDDPFDDMDTKEIEDLELTFPEQSEIKGDLEQPAEKKKGLCKKILGFVWKHKIAIAGAGMIVAGATMMGASIVVPGAFPALFYVGTLITAGGATTFMTGLAVDSEVDEALDGISGGSLSGIKESAGNFLTNIFEKIDEKSRKFANKLSEKPNKEDLIYENPGYVSYVEENEEYFSQFFDGEGTPPNFDDVDPSTVYNDSDDDDRFTYERI